VDGTARVQALEHDMAPRLHTLLEAYGQRSGIPVLLNTSFNLAGEPIVNRVVEGYTTFRRSGIDVLIAGQTRLKKRASLANAKEEVTCSRNVERSSAR
jgi:carbamoyltransferase